MKYLLFIVLLILPLGANFVGAVNAADLNVTCEDEGPCSINQGSGGALFSEHKLVPGDSVTRTITAVNNDPNDDCALTLDTKKETQTPADFASKLFTVIKSGATDLFGVRNGTDKASNNKKLSDLYSEGPVYLDTIPANGTRIYDWIITFDPDTGNFYKNAQTEFDFDMVFECGAPPAPAGPTNTPTPVPTQTSGGGLGSPPPGLPPGFLTPPPGGFPPGVLGVATDNLNLVEKNNKIEKEVGQEEEKRPKNKQQIYTIIALLVVSIIAIYFIRALRE